MVVNNLGLKTHFFITKISNNQNTFALIRNPKFHIKTKHIELQHSFVWEKLKDGHISHLSRVLV
jgi:hypothetical protein